jgi:GNAT superfamily N-acetyltransferase
MPTPPPWPLVDLSLSRRLERAEGAGNAASVEARARLSPEIGAAWIEVGGACAMFDGVGSPLTQTFGLGLFEGADAGRLDRIERFFDERGAATAHEVSPLADPVLFPLLAARGYKPFEFTSVMFKPLGGAADKAAGRVRVRVAAADETEVWAITAALGWSEFPEVEAFMRGIGPLMMATADATCFLAELDGEPVATAALRTHGGVALLAGASTAPPHRNLGAQSALLEARLRFAADRGCDLAMICALPGSASQRNAERRGFRIAYTRMKFGR